MRTAQQERLLMPQISAVLTNCLAAGQLICSIRMAPRDVTRLAHEVGVCLPRKFRQIKAGQRVIRSLVWDIKNGYILRSAAGPIQVMPDLSVMPGHIEMSTAESIPTHGLQTNN